MGACYFFTRCELHTGNQSTITTFKPLPSAISMLMWIRRCAHDAVMLSISFISKPFAAIGIKVIAKLALSERSYWGKNEGPEGAWQQEC